MTVLVLAPLGFLIPPQAWEIAAVIHYPTAEDLIAALEAPHDASVIVTDGLAEASLAIVADAIRRDGRPAVEVRAERWDGDTFSPVSAACRGVISGFGSNGLLAAVSLLVAETTNAH